MNKLNLSLSQQTLDSFSKKQLKNLKQEEPERKILFDKRGIKVTSNVQIDQLTMERVTLQAPNIIELNSLEVFFKMLNIVIEVDIERIQGELTIGGVTLASWDLFGDESDIRLTVGLEEYLRPNITANIKCNATGKDIIVGLHDFKVNSLNLPDNISSKIQDQIINELTNKVKEAIPGRFDDKIIDIIGNLAHYLPVSNVGEFVYKELLESDEFKSLIENTVKKQVKDEVIYTAPSNLEIGSGNNKTNISLIDANPIEISVVDQNLLASISFNDL